MMLSLFTNDPARHDGVAPINIYLMRLVYLLMTVLVGKDAWTHILSHSGDWEPLDAMAWSVWAAFSMMALLGIFRPVQMLPVLLLEIAYKLVWLAIVAYPLWANDRLAGSPVEGMAFVFAWVVLPIVALPWPYVVRALVLGRPAGKRPDTRALPHA